jgi:drug/metabolite transporter (DMT)-like permease
VLLWFNLYIYYFVPARFYCLSLRIRPFSRGSFYFFNFYGVFCLACPFLLIPFALKSLSTSETAIYLSSIPLFVLLLAWIFLKEKISLKKWFGFFIGMVGLIILSGPEGIIPTESSHSILPALILIIASILIAAGGIVIQIMPKTPPVQLAAATFLIAGLFVCPIFSLALPDQITSTSSILGLICVGTFSTFVGMLSRVILIRRAGAVFASINGYGAPVVASVLGVLF